MKINEEIINTLKDYSINPDDGIPVLLSLYYGYNPSWIPNLLLKKIYLTNIIEDDKGIIIWNTPLFEDIVNKFEWVKDYRNAFRSKNKERGGTLKACIERFRKFFFENPDVTLEEVKQATNLYLNSVTNYEYLTSAHYFISKGKGVDKVNSLEAWIEIVRENNQKDINRKSLNNIIQ